MADRPLIDEIADLAGELASVHARLLEAVAEAEASKDWVSDGATSCASWLVAHLGISHATAQSWVKTAVGLEDLPATRASFAAGALSYDQVRTVCRFATPESDTDVAGSAQFMSVGQLARIARRHELVDLDTLEAAYRRRDLRWRHDEARHTIFLQGQLPDDRGAVVVEALERYALVTPHDPALGVYDGFGPRAADALYAMASQSLGVDGDPDRATVVVHVAADTLTDPTEGNGVTATGIALHPETVRRYLCDGRVQYLTTGRDGTVGIGRTSRQIPAWLSRLLTERDQGCRFPGCHYQRWVHAHHIIHWSHGGRTDLDNLITLCGYHHRLLHEDAWRISGDPNHQVTWIKPDGTPYQPTRIERDLANYTRIMRGTATADTS